MAVPFSAGWAKCLLLIPVPHQLPMEPKAQAARISAPSTALGGLTQTHSLESLATGLTSALIKTSIPTAVLLLLLFTQQLALMSWFLRVTHSTLASPGHTPWGSWYLGAEGRLTASFSHFMLATSSLPFEDAWSRCLMRVYCRHLQQKCPKLLPQTLPAPPGALLITALLTKGLPALSLHHQHLGWAKRMIPQSSGCAAVAQQGWVQQAPSSVTTDTNNRSSDPANSFPSARQPLASSCVLHTADKGLFYFFWPQEIKFIFVTMYLIFWVSFRMIVCHSCIPQCKPENHWAMS